MLKLSSIAAYNFIHKYDLFLLVKHSYILLYNPMIGISQSMVII